MEKGVWKMGQRIDASSRSKKDKEEPNVKMSKIRI